QSVGASICFATASIPLWLFFLVLAISIFTPASQSPAAPLLIVILALEVAAAAFFIFLGILAVMVPKSAYIGMRCLWFIGSFLCFVTVGVSVFAMNHPGENPIILFIVITAILAVLGAGALIIAIARKALRRARQVESSRQILFAIGTNLGFCTAIFLPF